MKKFLPHPLLFLVVAFLLISGKFSMVLYATIALVIHESAHIFAARKRGFVPDKFSLTPFGATMSFDSGLTDGDEFFIAVAGPAANLVLCPFIISSWWLFPAAYAYTLPLFKANFSLALYNLIPVLPFDGGRVLLSALKDKKKVFKREKITGLILGGVFSVLGMVSVFTGRGFSLLFAAMTVLWYSLFPPENERFRLIFSQMGVLSSPVPLEKKDVYADGNVKLGMLLRAIRSKNVFYVIHITSGGREVAALTGEDVNALFFKNRKLTLSEAVGPMMTP